MPHLRPLTLALIAAGCMPVLEVGDLPQDQRRIPARVERILVTRFSGNPQWAPQASQSLLTALRDRLDRKSVISYADIPEPDIPPRRPGAGPRDEEEAIVRGAAADADAVVFGTVSVDPVRAEGAPDDAPPVRVSVTWKAVLMDVATRQVYVSLALHESRALEAAGPAGRPEVEKLDRKPGRSAAPTPGEATLAMIGELTNAFLEAYDGPPKRGTPPVAKVGAELPPRNADPAPNISNKPPRPAWVRDIKGFFGFLAVAGYEPVQLAIDLADKLGDYAWEDEDDNPNLLERRIARTNHVFGLEAEYFLADGNVDLAYDTYQRARELRRDDAAVLYNLGVIDEYKNRLASADKFYSEALKLEPRNSKYLKARERVFARIRSGPAPLSDE